MSSTTDDPVLFGPAGGPPVGDDRARLLEAVQPYCLRHALALGGRDALRLHGLAVGRGSGLVLIATEGPLLTDLATGLAETLRAAGHPVHEEPGTARRVPLAGARWPVELRKEPLRHPPRLLGAPVPVIDLEDAAALAVLALCDRALPGDLAALHALTARFREGELVALATALDEDFSTQVLADRLETAASLAADRTLQGWAEAWAQDLRLDSLETTELADGLHDPYLEEIPEDPDPPDDL
ncbi:MULTISPECIES: hypothetical protein [Kitasatospora]|uniref:Uncharacterized protein n=2 Tax=Kitasatospora TaxID=2063 RepID=A0ABT1IRR4_9ACTN|nr:hypothetical protein [Kitasatospora paracochleata]MCP2307800.1 hypothetical protein [Kitasatospora paracochleata]